MEERKAEYFAALMLLGNLMPYFEGLKDMEFQAKAFQCMNAFQAPYKAVLISLYESAVKNGNTAIAEEVKENFDVQVEDIAQRFRDLGLDDSLVRPSYVVNVSPLQEKINKTIESVRSFGIAAVRAVILVLFLECYRHWRIQSGVPCGSL